MTNIKVKVLKSLREKIIGLSGTEKTYPVFFRTRFGIHTFGVRSPIDVLILDSRFKVVRMVKGLPPNRIFLWPVFFDNVVELPAGEIERVEIKTGDQISLKSVC